MTIYFRNEVWCVTDYGIEMNKGTYALEALALHQLWDNDLPGYPQHIFSKSHPKYGTKRQFMDAWLVAIAIHPRPPKAKPFPKDWYERLVMLHPEIEL